MRIASTWLAGLLCLGLCGACGEHHERPESGIWIPPGGEDGGEEGDADTGGDDGTVLPDAGNGDGDGDTQGTSGDGDGDGDGEGDGDGDGDGDGELPQLDPPAGQSSGGTGGPAGSGTVLQTPTGESYRIITPGGPGPHALLLVTSGVEGGATMTNNLLSLAAETGTGHMLRAVVDGKVYYGDENVGQRVLDDVRDRYDVDNDRTYLLSESAGTISGLYVGFVKRQSYFAAYWANDINAGTDPIQSADELGFAPYGGVGPGGEAVGAQDLVGRMQAAGYQTPPPAPYDGPGANTHGSIDQFIYALSWFSGKSRLD